MSLPKNGAAVHFILSDSILSLIRNSELGLYQQTVHSRLRHWRNIANSQFPYAHEFRCISLECTRIVIRWPLLLLLGFVFG